METSWLDTLKELVAKKPLVVLRFNETEWHQLRDSRRSISEFTVARSHFLLKDVKAPAPCLVHGKCELQEYMYFGLISSRSPVTTLESRIKIKRGVQIRPQSEAALLQLVSEKPHFTNLEKKLRADASVVALSPKLSSHLIQRLASIDANRGAMRAVAASLSSPKYFKDASALQEDALRTALRAFGLTPDDQASSLELVKERGTALARIGIMEDAVIEHDARHLPGYDLVESDLTGRAVFIKNDERLEIYTANRRPLEHVFGVDLIYFNVVRQNIVMLQYKMLNPTRTEREVDSWSYRPDKNLKAEIRRMRKFTTDHLPGPYEYRINSGIFFLKFVKRDGLIRNSGIIIPIDHFEQIRNDPVCRGPKGGIRISYESLSGRYLRQGAFLDLIRSGYIGSYTETTRHLKTLIQSVLQNNRAVVAAIQSSEATDSSVVIPLIEDDLNDG